MKSSRSMTKRAAFAVTCIMLVIFGGSVAFMTVEGWDFWRSFFFTLITVTTVGYGAEGLSSNGERVAAVLLIGGIGTATYAFGTIMRWAVEAQVSWRSRMENRIGKLNDHYIICGYGRIGRTICQRLAQTEIPLVVIDGDHEACEEAKAKGFLTIRGNATEDEVLMSAGIERAKGIVCAVNSDSSNIVITLGAREMRPDIPIFARVDEDGAARKIRRAGASHIVSPFRTGAMNIADAIIHPNLSEFLRASDAGGNFELSEISVSKDAKVVGQSVSEIRGDGREQVVLVAIKRANGKTIIGPKDQETIKAQDVVIVAGTSKDVSKVCIFLGDTPKSTADSNKRELTTWGPGSPLD